MGSTRPVALGSACGRLSSPAGFSTAVAAVVVVSASVAVGVTVVGGPVGVRVLATVILKGDVAGGSVGLEVIFVGPGNKIYFLVMYFLALMQVFLIIRETFPNFHVSTNVGNKNVVLIHFALIQITFT